MFDFKRPTKLADETNSMEGLKVVKKSLIVGVGMLLLSALFVGPGNICSYVATGVSGARESFKGSVPVEFELERARQMVKDLDPEIKKQVHEVAKLKVEVKRLEQDVEKRADHLAAQQEILLQRQASYDEGSSFVTYGDTNYTRDQLKADLEARFVRFKSEKSTVENLTAIMQTRQSSLIAAEKNLQETKLAKKDLVVEIERLETEMRKVDLEKTRTSYTYDDSKVAKIRGLLDEIGTRIDVEATMVGAEAASSDVIPDDAGVETNTNISEEISTYFSESAPDGNVASK